MNLKNNDLYPVKVQVKGKLKLLVWGINNVPFITNKVINLIRNN